MDKEGIKKEASKKGDNKGKTKKHSAEMYNKVSLVTKGS